MYVKLKIRVFFSFTNIENITKKDGNVHTLLELGTSFCNVFIL